MKKKLKHLFHNNRSQLSIIIFIFFPNKCGIALVSHRKRTCKRQLLNIVYMKNVQNIVTLTHQHWGIYVIPNIYSISYWGCHKMIVLLSCVMFWYRFFTRLCFMVLGSSLKERSRSLLQYSFSFLHTVAWW